MYNRELRDIFLQLDNHGDRRGYCKKLFKKNSDLVLESLCLVTELLIINGTRLYLIFVVVLTLQHKIILIPVRSVRAQYD